MPIDGTMNPAALYHEKLNEAEPGGRYQVQRGYNESWALINPVPLPDRRIDGVFYTGSHTDVSEPEPT